MTTMNIRVEVHISSNDSRYGPGSMHLSQEYDVPRTVTLEEERGC
jgi:hypothetical protein